MGLYRGERGSERDESCKFSSLLVLARGWGFTVFALGFCLPQHLLAWLAVHIWANVGSLPVSWAGLSLISTPIFHWELQQ